MRTPGLLLLASIACQPSTSSGASDVVRQFYAATITGHVTGAPTERQLAKLSPYLSDTLRALLTAARRRSEAEAARAPDEKPPFVDGDLFSSLFEGPNAAEVIADSVRRPLHIVTVRFTYRGASPLVTWTDRAALVTERGRPVIDDIEYGGSWPFANKGTLRSTLEQALAPIH